jgi:hypothetical protein
MLLILRAGNRIEAYLVRDRLQQHGIKAHVFNEHMSSIVGDVPPDVALPQVWLDDDADKPRALDVLRDYFAAGNKTGTLFCRECREENPATFELCWNCGATL